ncbi:TRADD-N-associated membrane domain-containing protein [[Kitasatospora] papulosa]
MLAMGAFGVGGLALKEFLAKTNWSPVQYGWVGGAIGASFAAVLAVVVARTGARTQQTESESRARLNEAEAELEQALRDGATVTRQSHGYVVSGTTVVGDVFVPGARMDEPQDEDSDAASDGAEPRFPYTGLGLPQLWKTTHLRLEYYHDIATGQAKKSFALAQVSMVIGFALVVLFVILALVASTTAGAIVAGGLGTVSAALSAYISRTFIRSQESAATHLRSYFDEPLVLSRYLAAERLIADGGLSQDQRAEVLAALVQAMVTDPTPPPSPVVSPVPGQQGP